MPNSPSTSLSQQADSNTANLSEVSPIASENVNEQAEGQPEFRAHTTRRNEQDAAYYTAIYPINQGVYQKGARSLRGPYWVGRINSDGTYQLKDESGKVVKDGIKERDLQPF